MSSIKSKFITGIIILTLWAILAKFNDSIILPNPKIVLNALIAIIKTEDFYLTIAKSLARVLIGVFLAFLIGIPTGIAISFNKALKDAIIPIVRFFQSTPIISWILLALIWFDLWIVPVFILFLSSFPIIVINVHEGLQNIDKNLVKMSNFYKVSTNKKIKNLYIPSIISQLLASSTLILSSSLKIVVMAEIITKINEGIGSKINWAWINIETDKILAWTIIVVTLSFVIERAVDYILRKKLGKYYA